MTATSLAHRLGTALVVLLFGLGWGAPLGPTSCGAMGPSSPGQCDASGSEQHCEGDLGASAVCLAHHVGQEALPETAPSPPLQGGESAAEGTSVVASPARPSHSWSSMVRHAVLRAHPLHVVVGVWLE